MKRLSQKCRLRLMPRPQIANQLGRKEMREIFARCQDDVKR